MVESTHVMHGAGLGSWLRLVSELAKVRITIVVTLSVATGYFVFARVVTGDVLLPMLGTFLLACGSAALNQVQEAGIDARMPRTRNRPIPSGRIRRDWALAVALALLGAGFTVLASVEVHTITLLALGALAVFWYNGIYVALKRVTPFAVVPGSLIGAIPPVIGWVAAGGLVSDPAILTLAMFFYLWQIPHFWLLLIWFGDQYGQAGLPSLTSTFSPPQLARITFVWILAVATCGILMGASGQLHLPWNAVIVLLSLWLAVDAFRLLGARALQDLALPAFIRINLYVLLVMGILIGNALF